MFKHSIDENPMEIRDKYQEFKEFKRRVLNPTIKEINDYTDLQVEFTTLKKGRIINKIEFSIEEKLGYQMVMPVLEKQKERLGDE